MQVCEVVERMATRWVRGTARHPPRPADTLLVTLLITVRCTAFKQKHFGHHGHFSLFLLLTTTSKMHEASWTAGTRVEPFIVTTDCDQTHLVPFTRQLQVISWCVAVVPSRNTGSHMQGRVLKTVGDLIDVLTPKHMTELYGPGKQDVNCFCCGPVAPGWSMKVTLQLLYPVETQQAPTAAAAAHTEHAGASTSASTSTAATSTPQATHQRQAGSRQADPATATITASAAIAIMHARLLNTVHALHVWLQMALLHASRQITSPAGGTELTSGSVSQAAQGSDQSGSSPSTGAAGSCSGVAGYIQSTA